MQELIEKLQTQHNLTVEQSHGILGTIKNYIQGKFPMLGGAIDNLFSNSTSSSDVDRDSTLSSAALSSDDDNILTNGSTLTNSGSTLTNSGSTLSNSNTVPIENVEHHSSFLDKISDVIPGTTGEKIEDFTKKAADKISGFFEGNKKDS